MLILQSAEISPFWDKIYSLASPCIGILGGIIVVFINKWWEKKAKKLSTGNDITTKWLELSSEEREQLRLETKALHDREIQFYQEQIKAKDISIFSLKKSELAAIMKAHRISGDNNKLQMYVQIIRGVAKKFAIEIPNFKFDETGKLILDNPVERAEELKMLSDAKNVLDTDLSELEDLQYIDDDGLKLLNEENTSEKN